MVKPDIRTTFRKKHFSRCRICQKFGQMTKEHVPPKMAFNDKSYLHYYIDQVNKTQHIQWLTQEENTNGRYVFTLCEKCNNKTGIAYGNDYINFVKTLSFAAIPENAGKMIEVEINGFFCVFRSKLNTYFARS